MRYFAAIAALFFIANTCFAITVVFKNGKIVEGEILLDEEDQLRFIDKNGVRMTLKKSTLDWAQMEILNQPAIAPTNVEHESTPNPVITRTTDRSVSPRRVWTNEDLYTNASTRSASTNEFEGIAADDLLQKLRSAERNLNRLSGSCRNAGAVSPSRRFVRTETFLVNGKKVSVTGPHADPAEIQKAKRICTEALRTETQVKSLKQALHSLDGR
jgi:hypothetical protein